MRPQRIFLIRHAESQSNSDPRARRHIPDHRIGLTVRGQVQAKRAGVELGKHLARLGKKAPRLAVYLSAHHRTRHTFALMTPGLTDYGPVEFGKVKEDLRLREQEWGNLRPAEEEHHLDRERDAFGPFYYRIPGGESGADVYDRVSTFLETLHRDFASRNFPENVLLVTHGFTLRIFLMRWFHWSPEAFERLRNPPNCGVVELARPANSPHFKLVTPLADLQRHRPHATP